MGRKSKKNVKNQAPAEEPKNKRARKLAEELNAEELRALLAAKLSGTPLSPAGLEFVGIEPYVPFEVAPKPDEELDGVQCDENGAKEDDVLGNEGEVEHADGGDGAPVDGWDDAQADGGDGAQADGGDGAQADGGDDAQADGGDDAQADEEDGAQADGGDNAQADEEDGAQAEGGDGAQTDDEEGAQDDDDGGAQDDGEGGALVEEENGDEEEAFPLPTAIKDELGGPVPAKIAEKVATLKEKLESEKKRVKHLKRQKKSLQEENLRKDQVILRLTEENFKLKDKNDIPQVKFTTSPEMDITVDELKDMDRRASDSVGKFVSQILVRLVGTENLVRMSPTGKRCPRFTKVRNPDGTPAFPAKEGLDPKVVEFICDKVAERTAMKEGAGNMKLIREASKEEKIRQMIGWKIGNLVKAQRAREARELSTVASSSGVNKTRELLKVKASSSGASTGLSSSESDDSD